MNRYQFRIGVFILLLAFTFSCGGPKSKPQHPGKRPASSTTDGPKRPEREANNRIIASAGAGPDIRVGLDTTAREARVTSAGKFYVRDKNDASSRRQVSGEVHIRIESGANRAASASAGDVYRIQVATMSRRENATELRERLAGQLGIPVSIRTTSSGKAHQVLAGEFTTQEKARDFLPAIRRDYPDAFMVQTASGGKTGSEKSNGGGPTRVTLTGPNGLRMTSASGFLLAPVAPDAKDDFLRLNGKVYRGSFDIFLNKAGQLTLVNEVALEDYLLSVVPAEMSPSHYPEFAALAAQAIAARTYALKNLNRYQSSGFDLTDDTRTQVYGGVAMEKVSTSDIVRQTAGIIITYNDRPIDAMYMSTCGGRTEDISLVFGTGSVPYLKSVVCAVEHGKDATLVTLTGSHALTGSFRAADGTLGNRDIELARVIGLLPRDAALTLDTLTAPPGGKEAERLVKSAVTMVNPGQRAKISLSGAVTRGNFLYAAATAFFGGEEIKRRISASDTDYYMANLKDGAKLSATLRPVLAYLMQRKLWRPSAENTANADAPIRRGDAIALLLDWIEAEKPEILRRGDFVETVGHKHKEQKEENAPPEKLKIKSGGRSREFALAPELRLFRVDSGQITPIRELKLLGAEKLTFHLNDRDAIDFLEVELSPNGAASDRFSHAATWKKTFKRADMEKKLRKLTGDIGAFKDLRPARLGLSGRMVQIEAIGSRKTVVLNGYKVRGALGLQDTLFTIKRDVNADGEVTEFTLSGRGSGHGVGLCQTGAFGMAKAGKSYAEILKTYYTGVQIKKAY